jgi:radical SAM superfamily enzyme YgiQ (UPF0313 family)
VPVLYVHPAKYGVDVETRGQAIGRPYNLIPMGLVALVNVLRANDIGVKGVSYPTEKALEPAFDLREWLKAQPQSRVILIDLHWYEHAYGAISVARACKEILPQAWTVLGGLTSSAFSAEILNEFPEVDYVIRGDAEEPLLDLVQKLLRASDQGLKDLDLARVPNLSYRRVGQIVENELTYCASSADLDRLDFVDLSFLEHRDDYYIHEYIVADLEMARSAADKSQFRGRWLCNARGCEYNCYYCGGCSSAQKALAGRDGLVIRSPSRLVDDIERLAENRVIQVSFSYDIAELGDGYWQELFDGIRSRGIKIGLYNELFHMPKPEFVEAFVKASDMAHSLIALSPLSGSEEVRRLNGKFFTDDELFDTLDLLNLYNVPIFAYFSLNLLGENDETVHESIDLAEKIYQLYPSSLLKIINSLHTLDPLCPMSEDPETYGVETDMHTFMDYYDYCHDTYVNRPEARTEAHRGFRPLQKRSLKAMADAWDAASLGKEGSWWPIPPGW